MNRRANLFRRLLIILAAALILLPSVAYVLIAMGTGGLAVFAVVLFQIPIALGLLLGVIASIWYVRDARRSPSGASRRVAMAVGFSIISVVTLALLLMDIVRSRAAIPSSHVTEAQAVHDIKACQINSIIGGAGEITLGITNPPAWMEGYGNTYEATSSDWSALISAAQVADRTCPTPVGISPEQK